MDRTAFADEVTAELREDLVGAHGNLPPITDGLFVVAVVGFVLLEWD